MSKPAIAFKLYCSPHGVQKMILIERPDDITEMARELVAVGVRLEAEVLSTGEASLTAERDDEDNEVDVLAIEVVPNGPGVKDAVDRLIRRAAGAMAAEREP